MINKSSTVVLQQKHTFKPKATARVPKDSLNSIYNEQTEIPDYVTKINSQKSSLLVHVVTNVVKVHVAAMKLLLRFHSSSITHEEWKENILPTIITTIINIINLFVILFRHYQPNANFSPRLYPKSYRSRIK